MKSNDPINSLSWALISACKTDLHPLRYLYRSPKDFRDKTEGVEKERRPERYDIGRVFMFTQMWGSTALGFGGMGGAAMTCAETVIIEGPQRDCCVYFQGRLAYHISKPNEKFWDDVRHWVMSDVSGHSKYETKTITEQELI